MIVKHIPWDLHKKIMEVINDAGINDVPATMKMCLGWYLKTGQIVFGAPGSNNFNPTGVFTQEPVTNAWLKQRLNTTIGIEEIQPQHVWRYPPGMPPPPQPVVQTPVRVTALRYKEVFMELGMAAISGWCGIIPPTAPPEV